MKGRFLRASQVAIDFAALSLALALAFLVRFDGAPPAPMVGRLFLTGPYIVLFEYLVLVAFGVHRFSWRYVSLREAPRIFLACVVATAGIVMARLMVGELQHSALYLRHGALPFGVIGMNWILAFIGIVSVRVVRRLVGERIESWRRRARGQPIARTLLVGAGQAGVMVAKELASRPDLALMPVGFLDDAQEKLNSVIHGIPVLGRTAELPELCAKYQVAQVLITMANVPGETIRRIRNLCEQANTPAKIIPGVYEILGGRVNLSRIRDVAIEDLLRRNPVELDLDGIALQVRDKVVMVTGAGGSIGSELCRQLCRFGPSAVVLVERAENNLFNIHRELAKCHSELRVVPALVDVTQRESVREIVAEHSPALIFHAAAHKHVPMMEWNPREAIRNNVFGTRIVADAADEFDVDAFVLISTDKAVNPSSVMGATKRAAEVYVQALSERSSTRYVTVRFGNVLGSAGSVVPIFKEQIAAGGPVTVTHPDMERYFMTIPEACQLVLQAGTMGKGGEIFILDMGEPVRVVDLAKDLIELSGFKPSVEIEIEFTGVRPGEKLSEELGTDTERADRTRHPKIFAGRIEPRSWREVEARLEDLQRRLQAPGEQAAIRALTVVVPEYPGAALPAVEPTREWPTHAASRRRASAT